MAKRKHAAALFEVFHHTTSSSRPAAASRGNGWWFKGRAQDADLDAPAEPSDPSDPTTMTIRSPLLAQRIAAVEAMPPGGTPRAAVESREPVGGSRDRLATRPQSHDSSSRFHIDPDTHDVLLRVPLKTALIAAFGILVCVGLAYVLGRHIGNSEAAAAAVALAEETRAAEVRPSALDLPRHANHPDYLSATAVKPAPRPVPDDSRARDRDTAPEANSVHGITPIARPTATPADGPRIIGLNYLLIQNYPNQASATEARDFLVQNGIACTVEKVPAGFFCPDPGWMSVITSRGFDREELHTTEYEDFKKEIERLGDKFAGNGKFKRFSIQVYKLK